MAKFFKLLRSNKRRSSLSPSSPLAKKQKDKKQRDGIFRSTKRSTKKLTVEPPVIEAAITFSLSDDEESHSDVDIENQFSREHFNDIIPFDEEASDPIAYFETTDSVESKTNDSSNRVKENDKTMAFTHLEIMRNELAHMMQLANKDKEIYELKQCAEEMKVQYAEIVASKDTDIARIQSALGEVELALYLAQSKLASEESEHSNTIARLMQTQHDYYELSNQSWLPTIFRNF
jgi:hypothetical protein